MPKGTPRTCLRCHHPWRQRRDYKPVRCSACGSPYWDTPLRGQPEELLEAGMDGQEPELPDPEDEEDEDAERFLYTRPQ